MKNKKNLPKNAKKMRKTGEMEFTKIYVKNGIFLRKFTIFYRITRSSSGTASKK
jgi:hypothetical protein